MLRSFFFTSNPVFFNMHVDRKGVDFTACASALCVLLVRLLFMHEYIFSSRSDWHGWLKRMQSGRRRRRRTLGKRRRWLNRWRRLGWSRSTTPTWWTRCSDFWGRQTHYPARKDKHQLDLRQPALQAFHPQHAAPPNSATLNPRTGFAPKSSFYFLGGWRPTLVHSQNVSMFNPTQCFRS